MHSAVHRLQLSLQKYESLIDRRVGGNRNSVVGYEQRISDGPEAHRGGSRVDGTAHTVGYAALQTVLLALRQLRIDILGHYQKMLG
jgi:hypothetical protein